MKINSNQKNLYSPNVLNRPMTELEKIADQFPNLIYSGADKSALCEEFLAYNDDWSIITASVSNRFRRDPKTVVYIINSELDFYLANLRSLDNELTKRIIEAIEIRSPKLDEFVKDFDVNNFNDLPALIKLHEKLRKSLMQKQED